MNFEDKLNQFDTKKTSIENLCLGRFEYIDPNTNNENSLKCLLETDEYPSLFLDCNHPDLSKILETIVFNLLNEVELNQLDFSFIDFSLESVFTFDLKLNIPYAKKHISNQVDFEQWIEEQTKIVSDLKNNELIHYDNYKEYNKTENEKIQNKLVFLNLLHFNTKTNHYNLLKQLLQIGYKYGYIFVLIFDFKNYKKAVKKREKNKPLKKITYSNEVLHIIDALFTLNTPVIYYDSRTLIDNIRDFEFKNLFNDYFKFSVSNYTDDEVSLLKNEIKQQYKNILEAKSTIISVPIGTENKKDFHFEFSEDTQCFHAFIGGQTRSGKSNLLNQIITEIGFRYSSDDVRLFLMDLKQGVEFIGFSKITNALNVFQDLEEEIKKRSKAFKTLTIEQGKRIANIDEYNESSNEKLPRIILIVDEIQQLFSTGYREGKRFNESLDLVVRQGGGFGIHLVLCTQTLNDVNIQRSILSQIQLRIAFGLSEVNECMKILSSQNEVPLDLKKYEIVYNTKSGNKKYNHIVKTKYFDDNNYQKMIAEHKQRFPNEKEFNKQIDIENGL